MDYRQGPTAALGNRAPTAREHRLFRQTREEGRMRMLLGATLFVAMLAFNAVMNYREMATVRTRNR